jgi:hypothetical protein
MVELPPEHPLSPLTVVVLVMSLQDAGGPEVMAATPSHVFPVDEDLGTGRY